MTNKSKGVAPKSHPPSDVTKKPKYEEFKAPKFEIEICPKCNCKCIKCPDSRIAIWGMCSLCLINNDVDTTEEAKEKIMKARAKKKIKKSSTTADKS